MIDKVLYIDDDPTAQLIFRLACKKAGFAREIVTATNGQQALDYYRRFFKQTGEVPAYPELIFLDLDMPLMGGWEFVEQFMTSYAPVFSKTKIFIISSTINPVDKQKVSQYPCVLSFLSKPITVQLLTEIAFDLEVA